MMSRPAWARGLKHQYVNLIICHALVAPCVGAWIETQIIGINAKLAKGRALRGRVD